jgi:predicted nucleotidyltransferase
MEVFMDKQNLLEIISQMVNAEPCILSAIVYGSWLYDERSVDADIALIVDSIYGIVSSETYYTLRNLRSKLCEETGQDIDLVPHTRDELTDKNSPLWHPRYNPSLVFGTIIKGDFLIANAAESDQEFTSADRAAYVLHDNRTICRRQLVRSLNYEESRIFISKLSHGPGNVLTREACMRGVGYICSPSNISGAFQIFDRMYKVNSSGVQELIRICKSEGCSLNIKDALRLMCWYERMMALTFYHNEHTKTLYCEYSNYLTRTTRQIEADAFDQKQSAGRYK